MEPAVLEEMVGLGAVVQLNVQNGLTPLAAVGFLAVVEVIMIETHV